MPWAREVEQQPPAVAIPADVEDLRLLIAAAKELRLGLLPQVGGHGASDPLHDALLVRMDAFDRFSFDASTGLLRAGAGVRWDDVLPTLDRTGRAWAVPMPTSGEVSIVGFAIGHGHGWTSRRSGLAGQSVRRVRVMTPDGDHAWHDDADDPEFMWALRGAGALLGIVTEIELEIEETESLVAGSLCFHCEDAARVLRALRELAPEIPASAGISASLHRPKDHANRADDSSWLEVSVMLTDDDDRIVDRIRGLAPTLYDDVRAIAVSAIPQIGADGRAPSSSFGSSHMLDALDDATIDALCSIKQDPAMKHMFAVEMRLLGGAIDAPTRPAIASTNGAAWLLYGVASALEPEDAEPASIEAERFLDAIGPAANHRALPTFLWPGQTYERSFSVDDLARLRVLCEERDPDGVMLPVRMPDPDFVPGVTARVEAPSPGRSVADRAHRR